MDIRAFDFIVVGSGFGGSVSALRLSEKGYRVAVLEVGRRWTAASLPKNQLEFTPLYLETCVGIARFF